MHIVCLSTRLCPRLPLAPFCRPSPSWLLWASSPPWLGASRCRGRRQGRRPSLLQSRSEGGHRGPSTCASTAPLLFVLPPAPALPFAFQRSARHLSHCKHAATPSPCLAMLQAPVRGRTEAARMPVEGPQARVVVIGGERQTQTAKQSSGVGASWVWSGGWQLWAQQREVQRKCSVWRGRAQGVCLAVSVSSAWGGMERAGARAQPAGRPTKPTHKADNKLGEDGRERDGGGT